MKMMAKEIDLERIIQRRGSVSFDWLLKLIDVDYVFSEDVEGRLFMELMGLIGDGKLEVHRSASGVTHYRVPMEKKSKQEYPPVSSLVMSGAPDPEGADRLFKVIETMDEEFTVNQIYKAQKDDGVSMNRVRDLVAQLLGDGRIVAIRSKRYMGKTFNVYGRAGGT